MGGAARVDVRVACTANWFENREMLGVPVRSQRIPEGSVLDTVRAWWRARHCDAAVFNEAQNYVLIFLALRMVLPIGPRLVVAADPILPKPERTSKLKHRIIRFLLRRVDLVIMWYRDWDDLVAAYQVPRAKLRYVPFKVNNFEQLTAMPPRDDGFILACGRSHRDYGTLARAMEGLPYRAHILVPHSHEASWHGTSLDGVTLPPNVTIVHDDGTPGSWVDWISRAHFVVLPILQLDALSPAGIGTYLEAMALRKAVIITNTRSVRGVLVNDEAVIVPPGDVAALREAIVRVASDPAYRERVAAKGRAYAEQVRDERRLADDVAAEVERLMNTKGMR